MRSTVANHLSSVLPHLYINPLERCNLRCKICYTKKTSPILTESEILEFIDRYETVQKLETVTLCGGEVFTLPYMPHLINTLTDRGIFVQIITNGTINRLAEIMTPNAIDMIVSIDGLEQYHDANRGDGTFQKSITFLVDAHTRGFHTEIFSIATKQNFKNIDVFETNLFERLGYKIAVTYHPRKPPEYLEHHPISNIVGTTDGFDFLDANQMVFLLKTRHTFPPKELGCYQIALVSDSHVYGCCEGVTPIGMRTDPITQLISNLTERIKIWERENPASHCLGCSSPNFVCGIKHYLSVIDRDMSTNKTE